MPHQYARIVFVLYLYCFAQMVFSADNSEESKFLLLDKYDRQGTRNAKELLEARRTRSAPLRISTEERGLPDETLRRKSFGDVLRVLKFWKKKSGQQLGQELLIDTQEKSSASSSLELSSSSLSSSSFTFYEDGEKREGVLAIKSRTQSVEYLPQASFNGKSDFYEELLTKLNKNPAVSLIFFSYVTAVLYDVDNHITWYRDVQRIDNSKATRILIDSVLKHNKDTFKKLFKNPVTVEKFFKWYESADSVTFLNSEKEDFPHVLVKDFVSHYVKIYREIMFNVHNKFYTSAIYVPILWEKPVVGPQSLQRHHFCQFDFEGEQLVIKPLPEIPADLKKIPTKH